MEHEQKWTPKIAVALGALALLLPSCLKPDEFPEEPAITLKSFTQEFQLAQPLQDTTYRIMDLVIGFTDGDGDIGLDDTYNYPPFDVGSDHYDNLFCHFERLENGQWVDVSSDWNYRIDVITPTGQHKALNGEIEVKIGPYPEPRLFPLPPIVAGDTVRAVVRLEDRALHVSNTVTTEAVVLRNP